MQQVIETGTNILGNPLLAGAGSFLGTLGLATAGAHPQPDAPISWLPYALSVVGPILMAIAMRLLGAASAKKKALAEIKEKRAAQLRADKNPANDGEAEKLEDEAAVLRADAAALEAAKR
jgi:hypothetical protein